MKSILKSVLCGALFYSGYHWLFNWILAKLLQEKGELQIFLAHRIINSSSKRSSELNLDKLYIKWGQAMTEKEFVRRASFLKRYCKIISMQKAIEKLKVGRLGYQYKVLTFDDTYYDFISVVVPILKKNRIPATFFLTTGIIETEKYLWFDEVATTVNSLSHPKKLSAKAEFVRLICNFIILNDPYKIRDSILGVLKKKNLTKSEESSHASLYLTWSDIQKICNLDFIEIGAHTVTHPVLTKIPISQAKDEVVGSIAQIESHIGKRIVFFSYPNGQFNKQVQQLVRQHFKAACATGNGSMEDMFALKRTNLGQEPFHVFALRATGLLRRIKMLLNKIRVISI